MTSWVGPQLLLRLQEKWCPLAKTCFPAKALSGLLHPLELLPARRDRAQCQHGGSPARVTLAYSGELGLSLEANCPIQSSRATWLNRSAEAAPCRLREEIKHRALCRLASPGFFCFILFFWWRLILPFYWSNLPNGKKGWKELLPHHRDTSPSSTMQPRGTLPVFLKMSTADTFGKDREEEPHAWREKAEIGSIPWGGEKLPSLCNVPG